MVEVDADESIFSSPKNKIITAIIIIGKAGAKRAKKCLYEGVIIVTTALYGAEAWSMRSAERRKVNVLEMMCLGSLVGVSRMDRVRNEEVRKRAG